MILSTVLISGLLISLGFIFLGFTIIYIYIKLEIYIYLKEINLDLKNISYIKYN
jgi:hypothetical protein